jgi:hypothetical protein
MLYSIVPAGRLAASIHHDSGPFRIARLLFPPFIDVIIAGAATKAFCFIMEKSGAVLVWRCCPAGTFPRHCVFGSRQLFVRKYHFSIRTNQRCKSRSFLIGPWLPVLIIRVVVCSALLMIVNKLESFRFADAVNKHNHHRRRNKSFNSSRSDRHNRSQFLLRPSSSSSLQWALPKSTNLIDPLLLQTMFRSSMSPCRTPHP